MPADPSAMTIRVLHSIHDPAWEGWLRIYHASFPEHERMTDGFFTKLLARKEAGESPESHLLALTRPGDPHDVTGLAFYEIDSDLRAAFLWYVAIAATERSQGLGARFYADLVQRMQSQGAELLLFEVEMPELAAEEGLDAADWARRRIEWYRRQGARVLGGVEYFQSVDRPIPPVQMHIMAHPFVPMSVEEVYAAAAGLFEDAFHQVGPPALT